MRVLEMLKTDEGVFEFVKQHLINQGQKSLQHIETEDDHLTKHNSCRYRGIQNLKCAIGCLIEDDFYDPDMEQRDIGSDFVKIIVRQSLPNWKPNWDMLQDLQELHDECDPEEWENKLEKLEEQTFHREKLLKKDDEEIRKLLNYEN